MSRKRAFIDGLARGPRAVGKKAFPNEPFIVVQIPFAAREAESDYPVFPFSSIVAFALLAEQDYLLIQYFLSQSH